MAITSFGCALVLALPLLSAQVSFLKGSPRPLAESAFHLGETSGFAVADYDADGRPDVYLCNQATPSRLVRGQFDLRFAPVTAATDMRREGGVAGDVDGDGDMDIVFTTGPHFLINNGTGQFTLANTLVNAGIARCVALADVDGDRDLDIYFGAYAAQNRLFLNQGNLVFLDASTTNLPQISDTTVAARFVDVDRDGDPDIVVGNENQQSRLALNDGTGRFVNATATHMPPGAYLTNSLEVGDVDRDGDPDLIFGVTFGGGAPNQLYLNDGSGRFVADTSGRLPAWNGQVVLIDLDADGALDIVVGSERTQPEFFRNNGRGVFVQDTTGRIPPMTPSLRTMLAADLDRDGLTDLLIGNKVLTWAPEPTGRTLVLRNRGGRLEEQPQPLKEPWGGVLPAGPMHTNTIVPLDSDRDGDVDLIFSNDFQEQNRYFRNDGNGVFVDDTAAKMPIDQDNSVGMAAGDVDGDGLQDLVISNYSGQARLYRGRADGGFVDATAGRMPRATLTSFVVTLADLDRDGDLDIALGTTQSQHIYENDGQGFFADVSWRWPGDGNFTTILVGDFDIDGDVDLVTAKSNELALWRNSFNSFTSKTVLYGPCCPAPWIHTAAAADMDSDGSLDIVVFNDASNVAKMDVFTNLGSGNFSRITRSIANSGETGAAIADLDSDGDLDVVASSTRQSTSGGGQCWAYFPSVVTFHSTIEGIVDGGRTVSVADLDGDGDLDVVVGNKPWALGGGQSRIYANLTRHISVPDFSEVDGTMRVLTHASTTTVSAGLQTTTFASLALANTPIQLPPYGTLRIDPATAITLSSGLTNPATKALETTVSIPPNNGLRGASLYLQAIVEGRSTTGQVEFRFTNALRETIR